MVEYIFFVPLICEQWRSLREVMPGACSLVKRCPEWEVAALVVRYEVHLKPWSTLRGSETRSMGHEAKALAVAASQPTAAPLLAKRFTALHPNSHSGTSSAAASAAKLFTPQLP